MKAVSADGVGTELVRDTLSAAATPTGSGHSHSPRVDRILSSGCLREDSWAIVLLTFTLG